MAYVPGFANDVFVSFSSIDNEVLVVDGDRRRGWVDVLVDRLRMELRPRLGGRDVSFVVDHEFVRSNRPVTAQLLDAARGSATMLVVMSPAYLESEWCGRERAAFLSVVHDRVATGSMLVVRARPVPPDEQPSELRDLRGIEFFVSEPGSRSHRLLGHPDASDPAFIDRIITLSGDLAEQLRRLRSQAGHASAAPPGAAPSAASARQATLLFLGANPSDSTRLALGAEVREIDHRLRAAEHRDALKIEQAWAVRPSDLQECLLRYRPGIVHFSGHGSPAGQILLEDDSGRAVPVRPAALAKLFQILGRDVVCVVLNACYSEAQARAIVEHVGCVIGMSTAVKDASAIAFAGAFYQALAYGEDVQSAFELGCNQMELATGGAASARDLSPEGGGQGAAGQGAVPRLLVREGSKARDLRIVRRAGG